ncbi:cell division protein FtsQ/DivIB [Methylophilus medardicus]|uniref:Cell division protein FtsQ n=1 Tax=Methylophilus medardicus TaxID=2588534 RepID=A0A5B8CV39_9PROT|nr:cell division protein FtsQ/DivIB [Methylophilus medardicus]QDC44936.1 cell division protein FtsQ/DivIB [Methylophilus medardicus]QDC49943.1 cell division protein FtsQ/DivIB [Methylophilus medardicus]QDC53648.1 cell division protein FtsQ/DivIB [Methylophilus medardicus]
MWDKPTLLNWIANLLFSLAVVMLLYALLFVVLHLPIFPVKQVQVEGNLDHVNHEQIQLIVSKYLKGNFYTLDLQRTRAAFEKLPWARKVSVRRQWPDTIVVQIEEHQALGRWGGVALVNRYGELFQAASDAQLPTFYGPGDAVKEVAQGYASFAQMLSQTSLQIQQLSLSSRRAWEIKTVDGRQMMLGRESARQRLQQFVSAYRQQANIAESDWRYADLRYPNGFALRMPRGGA